MSDNVYEPIHQKIRLRKSFISLGQRIIGIVPVVHIAGIAAPAISAGQRNFNDPSRKAMGTNKLLTAVSRNHSPVSIPFFFHHCNHSIKITIFIPA